MSETEFVLFQNIIGGIETFLYAVCLTAFFYPFMTEKKERQGSKLKKILIVFGSYIAISLIGNFVPAYGWLGLMIVIILLTASSGYLGMNRNFTFFMGIIFFCIRNLSMLIVESIDFFTSRYWVQEKTLVEDIFRNASLNYIFIAAFRIFLFLIMLFVVGHRLGKQKIELQIRELCYLILTPIVAILFGNIIVRLWIVVKDDLIFQLYEQYPIFLGIVPVIAILFYAGILITIVSYQEMEKLQEEKKRQSFQVSLSYKGKNGGTIFSRRPLIDINTTFANLFADDVIMKLKVTGDNDCEIGEAEDRFYDSVTGLIRIPSGATSVRQLINIRDEYHGNTVTITALDTETNATLSTLRLNFEND